MPEAVPVRPLSERVDLQAIAAWTRRNEIARAAYYAEPTFDRRWRRRTN